MWATAATRAHVERLGVGAIHRVSGAQQAPIEIFNFAAHPPTLRDMVPSLWLRSPRWVYPNTYVWVPPVEWFPASRADDGRPGRDDQH